MCSNWRPKSIFKNFGASLADIGVGEMTHTLTPLPTYSQGSFTSLVITEGPPYEYVATGIFTNHGANLAGISSVDDEMTHTLTLPPNLFSGKSQTHHFTCEGHPSLAPEYVPTGATLILFSGTIVPTYQGSIITMAQMSC